MVYAFLCLNMTSSVSCSKLFWSGAQVKVPQQDNYCDCGLFLLAFIDYFTAGMPRSLRLAKRAKVDQHDLEGAQRATKVYLKTKVVFLSSRVCPGLLRT